MSRFTAIREALHAAVSQIPKVGQVSVLTGPQEEPKSFTVPGNQRMIVRVLVGRAGDPDAESSLDQLLDPYDERSVAKALEADPKLGGLVNTTHIVGVSGWRVFEEKRRDEIEHVLGAEWTVQIL